MTEHHAHPQRRSTVTAESFIDHQPFLSDRFDVHDYANAVIQGRAYRPDDAEAAAAKTEKGDLGVEVARLNYAIDDVTRQLRQEITTSYPLLLNHLTTSLALSSQLAPIRSSLTSLSSSIDRLHSKIHVPHEQLALLVRRLSLLATASDLTRRASRFVLLARRLEAQMEAVRAAPKDAQGEGEKERELAKAALSVAELDALLAPGSDEENAGQNGNAVTGGDGGEEGEGGSDGPIPLQTLDFVRAYAPLVDKARDAIITEMEAMVVSGLGSLNQPLLSSSLQTAHNLGLLPELVSNLVADLNDAVGQRVRRAFDSAAIGREVSGKDGGGIRFTTKRAQTEPSAAAAPQWQAVLWNRLEKVMDDVANCCIKVYTLEKVLKVKRDSTTQRSFLDEVLMRLDETPSFTFWTTLARAFEKQAKDAQKANGWLLQALSSGYPRLLRLFHGFFAQIAVATDTAYTQDSQSPSAVLVLRSVSAFEAAYLSRSSGRMDDAVKAAMSQYSSARQTAPGATEGVAVARAVANELDAARFDPLLVRTVASNAAKVLTSLRTRIDANVVRDFTATSLIGPQATPAQVINASFASCLYHCALQLSKLSISAPVDAILSPAVASLDASWRRITDSLDNAIRKEFASILSRMHRIDWSRSLDPSQMQASAYMTDLVGKLSFLRGEVLSRLALGSELRSWVLRLSQTLLLQFLRHASLLKTSEGGKLRLTSNMTDLEMALQNFVNVGRVPGQRGGTRLEAIGEEYAALRAFRQLLFADLDTMKDEGLTQALPTDVLCHCILGRSELSMPNEVHGWSEGEYVLWLSRHNEAESRELIRKAVEGQSDGSEKAAGMVGEVLRRAEEREKGEEEE